MKVDPQAAPTVWAFSPELVGRDDELNRLLDLAHRSPAIAIVEGEAGVGKSRLVKELIEHPDLKRRQVLLGYCQSLGEPFPLGPVIEALGKSDLASKVGSLSSVCGALGPYLPELAEGLPPPPEPRADQRAERHQVFRALREVLERMGPALLVLEDVHWSDAVTREFLSYLSTVCPRELMVVVTSRSDPATDHALISSLQSKRGDELATCHLTLRALGPREVGMMVGHITQTSTISEEFVAYLHAQTGGLPFGIEEVLALLHERGALVQRDGTWVRKTLDHLEVPSSIRESVLERVQSLSTDAQRVVAAASVLRQPIDEMTLTAASSGDGNDTTGSVTEALRSGVLVEDDSARIEFRHALARRAVYESIAGPERRRLHRLAARAYEARSGSNVLDQLAYHYKEAGCSQEWAKYSEAAADHVLELHDERLAATYLIDALAAPELPTSVRARLALKLGRVGKYLRDGRAADAIAQVLEADDLAMSDRAELRLRKILLMRIEDVDDAMAHSELVDCVSQLDSQPDLACMAMMRLAMPWTTASTATEHLNWLRRAVEILPRVTDPELRADVEFDRAVVLSFLGAPESRDLVDSLSRTGASFRAKFRASRGLCNLALGCCQLGHYQHARSLLGESFGLYRELGYESVEEALEVTTLRLDWAMGKWQDLEPGGVRFEEAAALPIAQSIGKSLVVGLSLLAHGATEEARAILRATAERAEGERADAILSLTTASAALARISLAQGDAEAAVEDALRSASLMRSKGTWVWAGEVVPVCVEALIRCSRIDEARDLLSEFLSGLEDKDAPAARAALDHAHALILREAGELEESCKLLQRSEEMWRGLPNPYQAALVREERGTSLMDAGLDAGSEALLGALDALRNLGASWDCARVEHTLRKHGIEVPKPWRGGRKGYGNELSPREKDVVALVTEGKSGREIAAQLFLSPRTVESHLANAMRKLGVNNRWALTARMEAAGTQNRTGESHSLSLRE